MILCDNIEWGGVGVGWEVQEEVNICILMADSHCFMAEQHFCKAIKLQLKVHFLKKCKKKKMF